MTEETRWIVMVWSSLFVLFSSLLIANVYKVGEYIKESEPTNISQYLKLQDDKIATQSATIEQYRERTADLEKQVSDGYETVQYMEEYLSKDEQKKFWDMWEVEICPHYHEDWYCKGSE